MALVLKDRVRVTSSTTGTGTFTLGSAASGFQDFSVIGDGNTTYYTIQNSGDNTWEVGIGTYTASGTTLSRDTVLESSNSGSLVNFAAGTKDVFVTYPAEKGLYLDASNNAIGLGTPASATLTNATGLPISTGVSGLGSGVATFLGTPSSSNLASAVTDETGSGSLVFATSPTLVTPALGTPSSGTLTSCTGLPLTTGVTGTLPVTNGGTGTATSFTTGSVIFAGASGVYSQNNAGFFWDNSNSRLGIGTTSPGYNLQVYGASNPEMRLGDAVVTYQLYTEGATAAVMGTVGSHAVVYRTNATERMRIDSSGNVLVNTTTARANFFNSTSSPIVQVEGTNFSSSSYSAVRNGDDNSGPWMVLGKSRGTTVGSNTIVQNNDSIGSISFQGNDGTEFVEGARIAAVSDGTPGANDMPGRLVFSTTADGAASPTERMRIDSSGNVGIGTSSPVARLHARQDQDGTTRAIIQNRNASGTPISELTFITGGFDLSDNRYAYINSAGGSSTYLAFGTGNGATPTERMRIDTSGNVGIGLTPGGTGLLELAAGTATVAPLEFTSGTNLTTPIAGTVEYNGTIMTATSNTNFKRGTIPITNYASGAGTNLTVNTETTLRALLPAANDTITLSIGTYFVDIAFIITRTGTSTTSATARLNLLGGGAAVGNFSGMSLSAPTAGGTTGAFSFDAVNINVSNVLTAASTTAGGIYTMTLRGLLKVTTSGTIIPQYNLSANLGAGGAGGASVKVLYFRLQQIDSQSASDFGPSGTGWA